MSTFATVEGFEEVWRPLIGSNRRRPETVLGRGSAPDVRARLARLAAGAPEVMVRITGRTQSPAHLRTHLDYITRKGALEATDQDGNRIVGRSEVRELGDDWSALALADRRRLPNSPLSHSLVLSMPAGTDPVIVRDAASAFAAEVFGTRFEYVLTLHTDTPSPHVHLSVCSLGTMRARLNPKIADLRTWREVFAQALRDRGVDAEATPRRARGVTRKSEIGALRRLRDRQLAGLGPPAWTLQAAYAEAAAAAFGEATAPTSWERSLLEQQTYIRGHYLAQAALLRRAPDKRDQELGHQVEAWVRGMPSPVSRRLALARELREANRMLLERSGRDAQHSLSGPERRR